MGRILDRTLTEPALSLFSRDNIFPSFLPSAALNGFGARATRARKALRNERLNPTRRVSFSSSSGVHPTPNYQEMTLEDDPHPTNLVQTAERAASAEREADQLHDDLKRMRSDLVKAEERIQQLERREDELLAQLERVDDGRSRKRTSPLPPNADSTDGAVAGASTALARNTTVSRTDPVTTIDEDIAMADASIPENGRIDWNNLRGIPAIILRYHREKPHARPPVGDVGAVTKAWEPASIEAWDAAGGYSQQHKFWVVELTIFSVYYGARHAPSNALTPLQQHALRNYCIPVWFLNALQRCCADRAAIKKNRQFWSDAKPEYGDPVPAYAAALQRNHHAPAGCPFVDNFQTLISRRVRGAMLWNAINVAPIRGRSSTAAERKESVTVANALLLFLALPHGYRVERAGAE
ncbi:hypothetical protein B0H14DRAFT_2565211 [Mycena olivaceomarginata]|nr:hypothetical protein B0H14DRAFT_2565211 [Mycena olivaceomarginata]